MPYVCSGGKQTELEHVVSHHGIAERFTEILGSPTTKVEHMRHVLATTGVAPEDILFVGDGWTDFKTSMAIGCHFVFLREMSDWTKAPEQIAEGLSAAGLPADDRTRVTWCDTWEELYGRVCDADGGNGGNGGNGNDSGAGGGSATAS